MSREVRVVRDVVPHSCDDNAKGWAACLVSLDEATIDNKEMLSMPVLILQEYHKLEIPPHRSHGHCQRGSLCNGDGQSVGPSDLAKSVLYVKAD